MPHDAPPSDPPPSTPVAMPTSTVDQVVVRQHQVEIGGETLRYASTTGRIVLHRERVVTDAAAAGRWGGGGAKPRAEVFFVAYVREGVGTPASRPVTFSFNGGPGSSSVWMHLGLLGPRRVRLHDDGLAVAPPYGLVDNPHALLDVTDLVFIDPLSTGFSRAVPGETPQEFHGFDGDVESVGDFIRLWIARFGRWSSPKFLIGESYGTTRAAAVRTDLRRHGARPRRPAARSAGAIARRPPRGGRGLDAHDLRSGAAVRRCAPGRPGSGRGRAAGALHRPSGRRRAPTARRSTTTSGVNSASRATCRTRSSRGCTPPGITDASRAATSTWSRRSGRPSPITRSSGCSSPAGRTTWPRRTSRPARPWITWVCRPTCARTSRSIVTPAAT